MPRISKRSIEGLQAHPTNDTFHWDSDLKGFGVRAKPSGAKSYLIQYRTIEGRSHRFVIGRVGTLTPDEARAIARTKLADVVKGLDPMAERQGMRSAPTVAEICDWYLAEARSGRLLGRKGRPIKASTLAIDESRINTHIRPLLGTRRIAGLTLDDVENLQADIAAGKTARPRDGRGGVATGGQGVAGRTVGMLRTIFEHAFRRGRITTNPARGVRKLSTDKRRERRLSLDELRALGKAMREATEEYENATGLAAIRLLLLTGFRRMEALTLEWPWIDFGAACIRFPDTKSGPQMRIIGKTAADFLKGHAESLSGRFVFPGERSDMHFVGLPNVLSRVCARAGLKGITTHTLRHTFASVAGDLSFTELTVAALLGHSARGITQRYVHLDAALVMAADKVSAAIGSALDGTTRDEAKDAA